MHIIEFIGCIPFLIYFLIVRERMSVYTLIPLIIYVNGFQYHILFSEYALSRNIDIYTNVLLGLYVNYNAKKHMRPAIGSFIVTSFFIANEHINSPLCHVLLIQWPLLYLYSITPIHEESKLLFDFNAVRSVTARKNCSVMLEN